MSDSLLLSLFFAVPFAAAILLWLLPRSRETWARGVALLVNLALCAGGTALFVAAVRAGHDVFLLRESVPLAPSLGIRWHLGADGLSATLLCLSGIIGLISTIASFGIKDKVRGYFSLLLLLFAGVNAVFVSLDMVLFYVGWELMLIPMFLLIALWGGAQRRYAALKFFFYTMAGSIMLMVVMIVLFLKVPERGVTVSLTRSEALPALTADANGMARTADLPLLTRTAGGRSVPVSAAAVAGPVLRGQPVVYLVQVPRDFDLLHWRMLWNFWTHQSFLGMNLAFFGFLFAFIAFAVKVPVFPLHTWLPHAHVQAPTAVSVILAGILLKLGVYGFLRVAWPLFPTVAASLGGWVGLLGVIAIVWGAFAALGQSDMKRLVAYASVSHMGYCLLGLSALTVAGISGCMVQMFSHGIGAAMLFLLVGVLYERAHHREVNGFGGLAAVMPAFAAVLLLAAFSSAGLPGLVGFVGELAVVMGAIQSHAGVFTSWACPDVFRWLGIIAATGVILSAAYLLWTVRRVAFGPLAHEEQSSWPDLTWRERFCLYPLFLLTILFGVWPQPLFSALEPWARTLSLHVVSAVGGF